MVGSRLSWGPLPRQHWDRGRGGDDACGALASSLCLNGITITVMYYIGQQSTHQSREQASYCTTVNHKREIVN